MTGLVTYGGASLNTFVPGTRTGYIINDIDHTSFPDKVTPVLALADNDGFSPSDPSFPSKPIRISGTIVGSSESNLDTRIDAFKTIFNEDGKDLDIIYLGTSRRYIAYLTSIPVPIKHPGMYATFVINFICQPFGADTSSTSLISVANSTVGSVTVTPTIGGNAPKQKPVFTITVDSFTGDADYLQVSNDLTGQTTLVYGQGLQAGDIVVFNSITEEVTINGVRTDYYGTFITLKPGASSITFSNGFDTRSLDFDGYYYKRYL